jgi:DNA gyrase subunit A
LALLDNPELTIDELMQYVTGPDFPTAALINGRAGILQAYRTGRGRIYMRSRATIEVDEKTSRETIIIHEIPYQVNKARMIEKIADLVKEKRIEGISEIRDESDKDGLRVVIELRRGEVGDVVLNNLYQQTQLEVVFGINMVALVDGQPRTLNLKAILECFLAHRREVVTRRTIFLLRKAKERGHLLEGLAVALANIDPVIALIKASASTAEARQKLLEQGWAPGHVMDMLARAGGESACRPESLGPEFGFRDGQYYLSPAQAQAILDLRLQKLTGMEHEKLIEEYQTRLDEIMDLGQILANPERMLSVIRDELTEIKEAYGDDRRTEIVATRQDLTVEDLIQEEVMVLTISHGGYAKTQPLSDYRAQRRGGRGRSATSVKEEDYVEHLLVASTHDMVMCFTNHGKVYWLKVFQFPQASRGARGRPVVNVLPLGEGEKITSILPLQETSEEGFILMATSKGTVKKVAVSHFARPRSTGLIAIELEEGDTLVGTSFTGGENNVMLLTSEGKGIRFKETDIRPMGRTARGVRGIKLGNDHRVISLLIEQPNGQVLTASANGYGKRTSIEEFPVQGRGGQGVIAMVCNERNGEMVGAVQVLDTDGMMLISDQGTLVRTRVEEVSSLGRNTQGVVLIRLGGDEHLVGIERVDAIDDEDDDEEDVSADSETTAVTDSGASQVGDDAQGDAAAPDTPEE